MYKKSSLCCIKKHFKNATNCFFAENDWTKLELLAMQYSNVRLKSWAVQVQSME